MRWFDIRGLRFVNLINSTYKWFNMIKAFPNRIAHTIKVPDVLDSCFLLLALLKCVQTGWNDLHASVDSTSTLKNGRHGGNLHRIRWGCCTNQLGCRHMSEYMQTTLVTWACGDALQHPSKLCFFLFPSSKTVCGLGCALLDRQSLPGQLRVWEAQTLSRG